MIRLFLRDLPLEYELISLLAVFYPEEKIECLDLDYDAYLAEKSPKVCVCKLQDEILCAFDIETKSGKTKFLAQNFDLERDLALYVCNHLYKLISQNSGKESPWGCLLGVRPSKLFYALANESSKNDAISFFSEKLLVQEQKINLLDKIYENQKDIIKSSKNSDVSLYISIPFCKTRCSYCSFVALPLCKNNHLVTPYLEKLHIEIEEAAKIIKDNNLNLVSIYIGGGTPSSISGFEIESLLKKINDLFKFDKKIEFTFEAGRADTLDEEKLKIIKNYNVNRISINPQSLSDAVLKAVGRSHSVKDFITIFEKAKNLNFDTINTDVILGLPKDTSESFYHTIDGLIKLKPENITIHTLALKRSSSLTADSINNENAPLMIKTCYEKLEKAGFVPYYMYRQSRMASNLENTGFALDKDSFGVYNIHMMHETHSIISCGASAVSKAKKVHSNELTRIYNFKYPDEYIKRFDEILSRKDELDKLIKLYND